MQFNIQNKIEIDQSKNSIRSNQFIINLTALMKLKQDDYDIQS